MTPEWMAAKFFKDWSAEDLVEAFKADVNIDLTLFIEYLEPYIINAVKDWFANKVGRPDLAAAFDTKEAKIWLRKRLERLG